MVKCIFQWSPTLMFSFPEMDNLIDLKSTRVDQASYGTFIKKDR